MSKRKAFFVAAVAAGALSIGSIALANTTEYSYDFNGGVGDWQGAIGSGAEAATVSGASYSYLGGVADRGVWPEHGYITQVDVYLDPAELEVGDGFDLTVASSRKDIVPPAHLRDFIFHVGVDAAGNLLVNGSNNSSNTVNDYKLHNDGDGTPATITAAGWYTFQHVFYDNGDGTLAVDLRVLDADGEEIFVTTRNTSSDVLATVVGGVRYQWFIFTSGEFQIDNQLLEFVTLAPGDKDDCKDGGFEAFGFENQGQCVASLQANDTAGK